MKNKKLLGASMIMTICAVAVAGIVLTMNTAVEPVTVQQVEQRQWDRKPLGDADPGDGNTGFMYFMTYPHDPTPEDGYNVNLSNATAYEYSDSTNTEMIGETPYSTTFDFVMKVRVNNSDGYNSTGTQWEDLWVRANLTVDFDYATDINDAAMAEIVIATDGTTYRWYHYYMNNSGSGYQLSKGESFNATSVTFDVYE